SRPRDGGPGRGRLRRRVASPVAVRTRVDRGRAPVRHGHTDTADRHRTRQPRPTRPHRLAAVGSLAVRVRAVPDPPLPAGTQQHLSLALTGRPPPFLGASPTRL